MRWVKSVYVAVILVLIPFCVNAEEVGTQTLFLMLDSGFVARPVDLELFSGDVHIAWGADALTEPTDVTVTWDGMTLGLAFGNVSGFAPDATIDVTLNGSHGVIAPQSSLTISSSDLAPLPKVAGASTSASAVEMTDETILLTLDSGFVGRDVSLGLFNNEFTLTIDETTLVAPTTLRLTRTRGGMMEEQTEAAKGIAIEFGNPASINPAGNFHASFKAYRPPSVSEQREMNAFTKEEKTVSATFTGEIISTDFPAHAVITFAPAYREGIMRAGIASWYDYRDCLCAASPDVPKGTRMKVSRADDASRFTVVTINDWGPDRSVHPDRVIDLDRVAFERIGNPRGGVLAVTVDIVKPDDPLYVLGDELPPPPWRW